MAETQLKKFDEGMDKINNEISQITSNSKLWICTLLYYFFLVMKLETNKLEIFQKEMLENLYEIRGKLFEEIEQSGVLQVSYKLTKKNLSYFFLAKK